MQKTINIKVIGRVQGVGFRWCTYEQFVDLGLSGKAENGRDGSVEIVATGEEAALEKLVAWCKIGPKGARINRVEAKAQESADILPGAEEKNKSDEKADT